MGRRHFLFFYVDHDFYAVPAVFGDLILPSTPVQSKQNKIAFLPSKILKCVHFVLNAPILTGALLTLVGSDVLTILSSLKKKRPFILK